MKKLDAHSKLIGLLCLLLLAGAGSAVLPVLTGLFADGASYGQMADAFDRVVPGMTQAQDLKGLGFDGARLLPARDVARRLQPDPAAQACLDAAQYCSALAFHQDGRRPADVTLLVMNGRVIHKVFSGSPSLILGIWKA